jgi:hypothetical protein
LAMHEEPTTVVIQRYLAPTAPRCPAEKGRGSRQQAAGGPSGPGPSWYGVVTA